MGITARITLLAPLALLASCAMPVKEPALSVLASQADRRCKVMYDQALISARGYADAQIARQLFWDCVAANQ